MNPAPVQFDRVAVFIDAENLVIASDHAGLAFALRPILDRIREEGQLIFARAYADWSNLQLGRCLRDFRQNVVELTQLPTDATGKNTADINLAVDALEMVLLPSAPDVVVLAAGDRDFVPLVQKIKRYGKAVLGIGVRGSASRDLALACDIFLFVDDIMQDGLALEVLPEADGEPAPAPPPAAPAPLPLPVIAVSVAETPAVLPAMPAPPGGCAEAFALLARAVATLARQAQSALGSNTCQLMQRLDSTFDLQRFGFASFKDFARDAEEAGYVRIRTFNGGNIAFDTDFQPCPVAPGAGDFVFDTPELARQSYRRILRRKKHLNLIPWARRRELVTHAWERLHAAGDEGLPLIDVLDACKNLAARQHFLLPERDIEMAVGTLNIARCFAVDREPCYQHDYFDVRVTAAVELEEACGNMHYTYLYGIKMEVPDAPLLDEAVAAFLFDDACDEMMSEARALIHRVEGKPNGVLTAFEDAFQRAGRIA